MYTCNTLMSSTSKLTSTPKLDQLKVEIPSFHRGKRMRSDEAHQSRSAHNQLWLSVLHFYSSYRFQLDLNNDNWCSENAEGIRIPMSGKTVPRKHPLLPNFEKCVISIHSDSSPGPIRQHSGISPLLSVVFSFYNIF